MRRILLVVFLWIVLFATTLGWKHLSSNSSDPGLDGRSANENVQDDIATVPDYFSALDAIPGKTGAQRLAEIVVEDPQLVRDLKDLMLPLIDEFRVCKPFILPGGSDDDVKLEMSFALVERDDGLVNLTEAQLERATAKITPQAEECLKMLMEGTSGFVSSHPVGRLSYPFCFR